MALRGEAVGLCASLVLLFLFACLPGSGRAQVVASDDERGRTHFEAGASYYEQERFADAAREFREAFELSGRPEMLINVARAHEHAGQIHEAVRALELLLSRYPQTNYRAEAQSELDRLRMLDVQAAPPPPPPVKAQPKAEPPPPAPRSFWPPRTHTLIVGSLAIASGVASLGVGLRAHGLYGDLEERCHDGACSEGERADRDRGQRLARTSTGLSFAALALASATAVLWVLDVKSERTRTRAALSFDGASYQARLRWEL